LGHEYVQSDKGAQMSSSTQTQAAPELKPLAVYTSAESAQIMRISLRKLRQLVANGELKPLEYATGKALFSGRDLARYIGVSE
jgi:hypothetical protein